MNQLIGGWSRRHIFRVPKLFGAHSICQQSQIREKTEDACLWHLRLCFPYRRQCVRLAVCRLLSQQLSNAALWSIFGNAYKMSFRLTTDWSGQTTIPTPTCQVSMCSYEVVVDIIRLRNRFPIPFSIFIFFFFIDHRVHPWYNQDDFFVLVVTCNY